jgi:hypothetical protein
MSATSAADCATALLHGWIQRFGVPTTITSDRGPQFTATLWAAICRLLSITHIPTTAYHPQANGLVERFHRRLKDALRARAAGPDWHSHLPWVLLGVRTAWREDSQFSPAEAVFGSQPVLPGQFLDTPEPPSPQFLSDFQGVLANRVPTPATCKSLTGPTSLPEELLLARHVLVRKDGPHPPLSPLYDGPFLVLERSLRFFKLQIDQRTDNVSTLRLKACKSPPDIAVAEPPRRGRPPNAKKSTENQKKRASRVPRRKVSFACPAAVVVFPPPPAARQTNRPVRSTSRLLSYTS